MTLKESLGLEPAQAVAQQPIRYARHGDADVAEPPGSGEHCEQDAARPSAADEFQRLLQAEAVARRPLSGSAALLRHWSIMTFRFVARNLWPDTTRGGVTSSQGTPTFNTTYEEYLPYVSFVARMAMERTAHSSAPHLDVEGLVADRGRTRVGGAHPVRRVVLEVF